MEISIIFMSVQNNTSGSFVLSSASNDQNNTVAESLKTFSVNRNSRIVLNKISFDNLVGNKQLSQCLFSYTYNNLLEKFVFLNIW